MHVSHRPLLPVWTPPEPALKATLASAEFVELAGIAEDLGEGGTRGRFARPRQGRVRQSENEGAALAAAAKNSSDIAKWSPASIATFDLTTIGATNAEPQAASPKDVGNLMMDAPENERSLADLLMTIRPPEPSATPGYFRSDGLAIRRRAEHDGGALLELFNEERFQHFGTAMERFASVEDLQVWLDSLGAAKFEIVGDVDGKAVGYGRLQPFGDRQSHSGWIFLGVREAFQRRRIGSALLQCLLATADILAGCNGFN